MNKDETTQPGKDPSIPDNLQYAAAEDIYNQDERVSMDDEGNIISKENAEVSEIEEAMIGSDLDVPGSELDDENEIIGEEDEENNYYSLGGDNHEDLEEDNN